jgi:RNA polymerase sigma-70 factor, ECF subfamily
MANRYEFEELVLPQLDLLYRVALHYARNPAMAEDLVQSTCLKGLRRFSSFRTGSNIKAWLLRILHNTWIDELRHRKVVGPTAPIEEQVLPAEPGDDEVTTNQEDLLELFSDQQVLDALGELPEEQRITLLLADVADLAQDDVAEITGVAVGTVKSRTSRAREMLKTRLARHAEELGFTGRRE